MLAAARASLARRVSERDPQATLRVNPPGVGKMSKVLLRFAEPIPDRSAAIEETWDTLRFAVTVWSYSLVPEEARSRFETGVLRNLSLDPQPRSEIQMPLGRKAQLFPAIPFAKSNFRKERRLPAANAPFSSSFRKRLLADAIILLR